MKTKRGTAGVDDLNGTRLADQILGLDGDDIISGKGGNDKLLGGEGSDEIRGGGGADKIFGDEDDDFLFGDSGSDVISGGDGNDIIIGGSGSDVLKGGDGSDRLFSNTGNDRMNGGEGDDYYEITADSSVKIDDRDGHDKIRFADTEKSWTITMRDLMFQRSGDDLVITVDGYKGETAITFFYAEEETYRIEWIYDEDPDHVTGYNLEIENILNLSNGDEPIRGIDLWEL
jgi:Ca2+-binding RTX toxin-like protein